VVVGFVAAAVEAVFEQAHLGFEVGETLLQFGFALRDARLSGGLRLGVGRGELFFEFGFTEGSAVVESLVVVDLLPGLPEELLAGEQAARSGGREGVEGAGVHNQEYAKSAGPWAGR
jgi:hypothetical protein